MGQIASGILSFSRVAALIVVMRCQGQLQKQLRTRVTVGLTASGMSSSSSRVDALARRALNRRELSNVAGLPGALVPFRGEYLRVEALNESVS